MFLALVFRQSRLHSQAAELQIGQYIREEGPQDAEKAGTPTMGGVLIVLSTAVPVLLSQSRIHSCCWHFLPCWRSRRSGSWTTTPKVAKRRNLGLTGKRKLTLQFGVSLVVGITLLVLSTHSAYSTQLVVPFLKRFRPDLVIHGMLNSGGLWPLAFTVPFLAFIALVITGSSNAVNLTDGLDGLAIGCTVIAAGAMTMVTYVSSNYRWATYLEIQYIPRVGELTVFCGALVGAVAFWLSLVQRASRGNFHGRCRFAGAGRNAGNDCVKCRRSEQEVLLIFVGGVFVLEALLR